MRLVPGSSLRIKVWMNSNPISREILAHAA
jgi:hypothetical protein